MRSLTVIAMGAMLGASLLAQPQQPPKTHLKVGDMAPDFTLRSVTWNGTASAGGTVKLSDFRGKNMVVLAFYPAAFTGG